MANCSSQPSGVRSSGLAITPALLTRMCSGPSHAAVKAATEDWSARSSMATWICLLPVLATSSSAVACPASGLRTARVTSAPAPARARAVSTPMPEAAPVTTARRPVRSTPAITSAAVDCALNGVVKRVLGAVMAGVPVLLCVLFVVVPRARGPAGRI